MVSCGMFSGDSLDPGDHVLQFGNLAQCAPGRQAIVLRHSQDERALVRLQAFEESIELVRHGPAVAAGAGLDNRYLSSTGPCARS
jgi:hypothetical protein